MIIWRHKSDLSRKETPGETDVLDAIAHELFCNGIHGALVVARVPEVI